MVDAAAAEEPGRLAMIHVDDAGVRRDYSFGFFSEQSARLGMLAEYYMPTLLSS